MMWESFDGSTRSFKSGSRKNKQKIFSPQSAMPMAESTIMN